MRTERENIPNPIQYRTSRGTQHYGRVRIRFVQVRRDCDGVHDESARVWVLNRRQRVWWVCNAFGLKKHNNVGELDPDGREW